MKEILGRMETIPRTKEYGDHDDEESSTEEMDSVQRKTAEKSAEAADKASKSAEAADEKKND